MTLNMIQAFSIENTLVTIDNPLPVIFTVDTGGAAMPVMGLWWFGGSYIGRPLPIKKDGDVYTYRIDIAPALRAWFGDSLDDTEIPEGTAERLNYFAKYAAFEVGVDNSSGSAQPPTASFNFTAIRGAAQWGVSPNIPIAAWNNDPSYFAGYGQPFYVYYFHDSGMSYPLVFEGTSTAEIPIPARGMYRYRCGGLNVQNQVVEVFYGETLKASYPITLVGECGTSGEAKFLDSSGRYRVLPVDDFTEVSVATEKIGEIEVLGYGTYGGDGNIGPSRSAGVRATTTVAVTVPQVPATIREPLARIVESPRVFLKKSEGVWVKVDVGGAPLVKTAKSLFEDVQLTFSYEQNTIRSNG